MAGKTGGIDEAARYRPWAAAIVAVVLASAGCTICPDPFDYSGPVPDGSPPQNDFRARAGGILPVGAAPRPWPPIVRDFGRPDELPVIAEEETEAAETVVAEDAAAELRQTSVLVPEPGNVEHGAAVDGEGTEAGSPASPEGLLPVPQADPRPGDPTADADSTGTADLAAGLSQPQPSGAVVSAAASGPPVIEAIAAPPSSEPRESPGWRPRRRPTR